MHGKDISASCRWMEIMALPKNRLGENGKEASVRVIRADAPKNDFAEKNNKDLTLLTRKTGTAGVHQM